MKFGMEINMRVIMIDHDGEQFHQGKVRWP
jgi:hypothetical protein